MAIKYAITGGGNWSGDTWATASNRAVSDTTKPIAGDTAVLDQYSGSVTVDTSGSCAVFDATGYTKDFIMNAAMATSSHITLPDGVGGTFTPNTQNWVNTSTSNIAIKSNGKSFYSFTNSSNPAFTITCTDQCTLTGALIFTGSNPTPRVFTLSGTLSCAGITFNAGVRNRTLLGGGATIILTGGAITLQASTLVSPNTLIINGNPNLSNLNNDLIQIPNLVYISGTPTMPNPFIPYISMNFNTNGYTWEGIQINTGKTVTLSSPLQAGSITWWPGSNGVLACGTNDVTLSGNWTADALTSRTGNNTFIFNGTSVLSGATNFYNVTINPGKTVRLTYSVDGRTFSVLNTFTANGTANNPITLNSTSVGNRVRWDTSADTSVNWVNATDIDSGALTSHRVTVTDGSVTNCVNWRLWNSSPFMTFRSDNLTAWG